jgi:hypothetical protein
MTAAHVQAAALDGGEARCFPDPADLLIGIVGLNHEPAVLLVPEVDADSSALPAQDGLIVVAVS